MKAILGKKIGMTQIFNEEGEVVPVTIVEAGPCVITKKKTLEKDGYQALQIGFGALKEKKATKLKKNQFKSLKNCPKVLKEIRLDGFDISSVTVGQEILADIFDINESVNVSGITKGKGFAGGIKRWNFARGLMTHGSKSHRLMGSVGASDRGGKIFKGKKMAGRLGNEKMTVKNNTVVGIDGNVVLLKGNVPGSSNGIIFIYNGKDFDLSKFSQTGKKSVQAEEKVEAKAENKEKAQDKE